MMENEILVPKNQFCKLDQIMHSSLHKARCCDCLFSGCKDKAINSHTFPENMLYKIDPVLKKILYFTSGFIEEQKQDVAALFKPINADRFSAFPGFCPKHDHDIFVEIDNFDGVMSQKKALRIHYRNICYGIANIMARQKQVRVMEEQEKRLREYSSIEFPGFWELLKNKDFSRKLQYCLDEHIKRKIIMEKMIEDENYEQISFEEFLGHTNDPVFSGRSGRSLNPEEDVYRTPGYNIIPWVSYITLINDQKSFLIFCWLETDRQYAEKIVQIGLEKELRSMIEVIAYCESDAVAIHVNVYNKHKNNINFIIKKYTECYGRFR